MTDDIDTCLASCPRPPRTRCNHPDRERCCGGGSDAPCDCTECHGQVATPGATAVTEDSSPAESCGPPGLLVTPQLICSQVLELMQHCCQTIDKALVGRFVRVTSDHNGQPYGRSRKSWKGQVCRIRSVSIDPREGELQLCLEGHEFGECFIRASEVEFV